MKIPVQLFNPLRYGNKQTPNRHDRKLSERKYNETLQDLIAGMASGDRSAFKSLYDLASPRLFGMLFKMLKEPQLAEDALQETFIQLWTNAGKYHPDRSEPITWMQSIARYRAIDLMRRKPQGMVDIDNEVLQPRMEMLAVEDPQPDSSIGLAFCMEQLSSEQRDLLLRCYCEGYSHSELSKLTAKPLGTIKSWIRRALVALRECLEK